MRLWQLILVGPFLIFVGVWEWFDLDTFEKSGSGTKYVNKLTYVLYQMGGKSAVLAVWAGFGAFYIWMLMRYLRLERAANAKLAELEQRQDAELNPAPVERPKAPIQPPKPTPPKPGDTPFRSAPAPQIVVVAAAAKPVAAPVVAGDPDDKPKLLT